MIQRRFTWPKFSVCQYPKTAVCARNYRSRTGFWSYPYSKCAEYRSCSNFENDVEVPEGYVIVWKDRYKHMAALRVLSREIRGDE